MILGSIYLLLGLAIIAMCFNLMREKISTQVRKIVYKIKSKYFSLCQVQFLGRMMGVLKSLGGEDDI